MSSFANIVMKSLPQTEVKSSNPNFDIKQRLANILKISNNDAWEIVDSIPDQNLYMVHYSDTADLDIYGYLRGTIIDIKAGIIIRKGIGYTPTVTTDQLTLKGEILELIDEREIVHTLKKFMITRGFEATTISIFKHNSKVYHSTNKRIDSSKSKWGGSATFLELYYEVGGLAPEELFSLETVNSPFIYETLIVHKSLLNVTKLQVGVGFLVSLGVKTMWTLQNTPYSQTTTPNDFIIKSIIGTDKLPLNPKVPVVYTPTNIDIKTSNDHLIYGFYDQQDYSTIDQRLAPGEFVIVYSLNDADEVIKTYKVQSSSYAWRWNIRNNDPNIKHRLYQLSSSSNNIVGTDQNLFLEDFVEQFPVMEPYEIKQLQAMTDTPIIAYPQTHNFLTGDFSGYLDTEDKRFYNIFLCLFIAIPLHLQKECLTFYDEFIKSRTDVIDWLKKLSADGVVDNDEYYRVNNIIVEAKKQAKFKSGRNGYLPKDVFQGLVNAIITTFIHRERGESLYKLVKLMKNEKANVSC